MLKTIGISPKLYVPVVAALTALLTSWVATGTFDEGEVRGLIATAVLAAVAYVAPPGDIDTTGAMDLDLPDLDGADEEPVA
ncbi:MAG: hypothetical protein WKF48_05830 [Solirubrobacteraceae bacterium]